MENNPELQLAWQFIENTGTHLFLTGKAGTGKTTFLKRLREHTPKRMVVLAPTGIAAINAGGVTIHSFFQISFAPFVPETTFNSAQIQYRYSQEKRNIIRSMDLLVIDEISMVRADLLDAVDATLRRYRNREKPFGGVQLLMIGDLQQLAPVVKDSEWSLLRNYYETPYFFASRGYIRLTTHNNQAQQVNDRELASLPGKPYHFRAEVTGTFPEYTYPADEILTIKEGAQIMFLKNDVSLEKRYYNGMIGEVVAVNDSEIYVKEKGSEEDFLLLPEEWGNYKYVLNEETKEITEVIEGTFRQYPIRLAWAITIHKSQGLTFERAIIDARNSFAHGQTYVALSRCKTLEGLVLESPLRKEAIISDSVVDNFTKEVERNKPGNKQLSDMQKAYFFDLLSDLFNFYSLEQAYKRLLRMLDEDLYKLYPKLLTEYKLLEPHIKEKIVEVAHRFRNQYTRLINESEDYASDQELQERIRSGAVYFHKELEPIRVLFAKTNIPLDNRELRKQLNERLQALDDALWIKESLLKAMCVQPFIVAEYLKLKAKVMLSLEDNSSSSPSPTAKTLRERKERVERTRSSFTKVKVEVPTDILHPELYRTLSEWRTEKTRETNMPAYVIMQQKALMGIVNLLPDTPQALEAVPYFGAKGVEKYGLEILGIVRKYMRENQVKRPEIKEIFLPEKSKRGEKREPKKDTKQMSYEMFCKGMSMEEIAKSRDLVTGTIATHLEHYVRMGKIKLEQVVAVEKIEKIRRYQQKNENSGVAGIKAALGDEVSYADIRFVFAADDARR